MGRGIDGRIRNSRWRRILAAGQHGPGDQQDPIREAPGRAGRSFRDRAKSLSARQSAFALGRCSATRANHFARHLSRALSSARRSPRGAASEIENLAGAPLRCSPTRSAPRTRYCAVPDLYFRIQGTINLWAPCPVCFKDGWNE